MNKILELESIGLGPINSLQPVVMGMGSRRIRDKKADVMWRFM